MKRLEQRNGVSGVFCSLLGLGLLVLQTVSARADRVVYEVFRVPDGILLGESPGQVASVLNNGSGKITERESQDNTLVWKVEDLFIRHFQSGTFTFENQKLTEIEFRYGQDNWPVEKHRRLMRDYRILLEHRIGFPSDSHREVSQMGSITESTEAFIWYLPDVTVQLVLFRARQEGREYVVFSAHIGRDLSKPGSSPPKPGAPLAEVEAAGPGMMLFADDPSLPKAAESADDDIEMPEGPLPQALFGDAALAGDTDEAEIEAETETETQTQPQPEAEPDVPDDSSPAREPGTESELEQKPETRGSPEAADPSGP